MKEIYLAGGCFWGTEHLFKQVAGVTDTQVGYANGHHDHPTYKDVCTDGTGHAETVRIAYDEQRVSLDMLLDIYFMAIDPTSVNQQGEDRGTQYRTGIYYVDEADRAIIDRRMAQEADRHSEPLAVEVEPLRCFWPAEDYHQDYLDKNPQGYCHIPLELMNYVCQLKGKP